MNQSQQQQIPGIPTTEQYEWVRGRAEPRHLESRELRVINSYHDAFLFMINEYHGYDYQLADELGIGHSHFNMMKNAHKHPQEKRRHWPSDDDFVDKFEWITGVYAYSDYREKKKSEIYMARKLMEVA